MNLDKSCKSCLTNSPKCKTRLLIHGDHALRKDDALGSNAVTVALSIAVAVT